MNDATLSTTLWILSASTAATRLCTLSTTLAILMHASTDYNNTNAYTWSTRPALCNVNQAGNHQIQTRATYDQTWNKPLSITTPNEQRHTRSPITPAGNAGAPR